MRSTLTTIVICIALVLGTQYSAQAGCASVTITNNSPCDVVVILTDDAGYEWPTSVIPNTGTGVPVAAPAGRCWLMVARIETQAPCAITSSDVYGWLPGAGVSTALKSPLSSATLNGCTVDIN